MDTGTQNFLSCFVAKYCVCIKRRHRAEKGCHHDYKIYLLPTNVHQANVLKYMYKHGTTFRLAGLLFAYAPSKLCFVDIFDVLCSFRDK